MQLTKDEQENVVRSFADRKLWADWPEDMVEAFNNAGYGIYKIEPDHIPDAGKMVERKPWRAVKVRMNQGYWQNRYPKDATITVDDMEHLISCIAQDIESLANERDEGLNSK
jgi:hypothetical protein